MYTAPKEMGLLLSDHTFIVKQTVKGVLQSQYFSLISKNTSAIPQLTSKTIMQYVPSLDLEEFCSFFNFYWGLVGLVSVLVVSEIRLSFIFSSWHQSARLGFG